MAGPSSPTGEIAPGACRPRINSDNGVMIDRIAKLLAKAERAATPAEAQAYFDKAQALATAHSISLAKARLATTEIRISPINKRIVVGEPRRHANRHLINLMYAVATANDLQMDIAHNSTYLILFGFPSDIAAAEMLWSRISTQMVRYGEEFLAAGEWRADVRLVRQRRRTRTAPMTKQTARAQYYESFIAEVQGRLRTAREREIAQQRQREEQQAQNQAANGPTATGTEIALREKAAEVADYYQQSSEARGSWRGGSRVQGLSPAAEQAGRRDAHRVALPGTAEVAGGRPELPA